MDKLFDKIAEDGFKDELEKLALSKKIKLGLLGSGMITAGMIGHRTINKSQPYNKNDNIVIKGVTLGSKRR